MKAGEVYSVGFSMKRHSLGVYHWESIMIELLFEDQLTGIFINK